MRDTPISEAAFCGAGVGAAIAGMRPVVEVQIFDFMTLMMDMIVNQAAKFRYMFGGQATVPLVIRGPQGGGIRLAAQHTQSLEAWFAHVPGLVVVAPSSPYDAKGLLKTAIRDDNPVIFLEHKMLYLGQAEPVPEELRDPDRQGGDPARGHGRHDRRHADDGAARSRRRPAGGRGHQRGGDRPAHPPAARHRHDRRVGEADQPAGRRARGLEVGGFGAEVAASVTEEAFDWLDAPVARVGALDVPMPFNDRLERAVIPSAERIVVAVKALFG